MALSNCERMKFSHFQISALKEILPYMYTRAKFRKVTKKEEI